ncbi:MAG: outer membrane protein assembly factor BamB family protein, partial [Planctomycetota bacterium]
TWTKTVKPRPSEIDEWTHYLHDATNNAVADDTVVGPPRRSQWLGSPRWSRHHDRMASTSACVSANGRIFYIIDEGSRACIQLPSRWSLIARDAFNGTVLWKQPIAAWVTQLWPFKSGPALPQRRLVAVDDRVYVTLGLDDTPLSTLDAATGRIIRTHPNTTMTEEIIFSNGVLFIVVKDTPAATTWNDYRPIHRSIGNAKTRVANEFPWDANDRSIMAIDADTGDVLWQKRSPVAPLTLAADANAIYFHDANSIVRWNRDTGEQLWSSEPIPIWSPMPTKFGPTLVIHKNVVLFEGGDPAKAITAVSAATGETLWASNHPATGHNCPYDLLVIDDLAWVGAIAGGGHSGIFTGWDINTGEIKKEFPPDVDTYWFHHRCYRAKATVNYLLPARTGTEFIDFRNETWTIHHWVRGGCLYGVMPCNGLLYTPPHNCACYLESKQYGFGALAAAPTDREHPRVETDAERLHEGPAYGTPLTDPPGEHDWPTYRCETTRSGFNRSIVGTGLRTKWQTRLNGDLTTLTIANDRVYLADKEEHTLFALDEDTGSVLWTYTAGGRVDSPPTIYKGRVIFGSADGHVYCLRASDGALIWRFQAAPQDLRMPSFEQVESVWPLHGSVLVQDDMVYCVAGRSMFLDGGLRFLRLNPETGEKISEKVLDDADPASGQDLQIHIKRLNMPVAQADILTGDGEYVYMHSQRFDLEGNRQDIAPHSGDHNVQGRHQYGTGMHLFSPTGFLDGEYMHRTYWVFGKSWCSGAGGYHRAGAYAPAG